MDFYSLSAEPNKFDKPKRKEHHCLTMSRRISLLITGLTMPATKRLNPNLDTAAFGKTLDTSIDGLKAIPGLYYQRFDLDHEAPAESPESVAAFKKVVKDGPPQGGEWNAYFLGAGLRIIPSLTPLFEDLVNTIIVQGKGKAKVMFSANAADHVQVVKRVLPELDAEQSSG